MTLYNIIIEQLKLSSLEYKPEDLQKTDIIEYMVLEAASILPSLQPIDLITKYCIIKDFEFPDKKPRSVLEFGIKETRFDDSGHPVLDEPTALIFKYIMLSIRGKYSHAEEYFRKPRNNPNKTLCSILMLNEDIEHAIRTSSLFIAAGDISQLSAGELLMLEIKLERYKIKDLNIASIAASLIVKIRGQLRSSELPVNYTGQISEEIKRDFESQQALQSAVLVQKHKFNQLLSNFDKKITELTEKGLKRHIIIETEAKGIDNGNKREKVNVPLPQPVYGEVDNNEGYIEAYAQVANAAHTLNQSLKTAQNTLYKSNVTLEEITSLEQSLTAAMNTARIEFSKFRGKDAWYNDLHPILKGIIACVKALAGILAGVAVIPALVTSNYTHQGYIGTFFKTQTNSLYDLELFQEGVNGHDGVIQNLKGLMTP